MSKNAGETIPINLLLVHVCYMCSLQNIRLKFIYVSIAKNCVTQTTGF